ncbi:MAG: tetratricopeptide repeat protein, partial [Saprospiraceae bacterium]|nr:tetratricopeptide repeat protein [Saprospiraceae bacterium]
MIRLSGKIFLLGALFLFPALLFPQESYTLNSKNYFFPDGNDYLSEELFGLSLHSFESKAISDGNIAGASFSSFKLDESRSIDLLLESVARSSDERENNEIYAMIANKYFARKEFKTARNYFKQVDDRLLSPDQYVELNFKLGYTLLLEKKFSDAKGYFSKSRKYNSPYEVHADYYIGICAYFLNQKEEAIRSFESVENSKKYRDLIPYYLAQIYFKDGNYDEAIRYAEKKLSDSRMQDKAPVYKILGLSYLAKNDFEKSLQYLDAYARESPKLTENEFYQIGVSHYKLGQFFEAEELFSELSHQNTSIGQVSNFLLGSIYLNAGEQKNAQSAFKQASKHDYFPDIREESQFLYYKLSAELGEERVAMNGLSNVTESSPYFREARDLLAEVLLRSKDHVAAIGTIENLTQKSDKMLNTYKNLTYDYGIQNFEDGQLAKAIEYLKISRNTPGDETLQSDASFWLAYAYELEADSKNSERLLDEYLASSHQDHKFEAYYLKSYQDIQNKAFKDARKSLEMAVAAFDVNQDQKTLFDDAIVRLADLELLDNNYLEAISYYDLAIENNAVESDYILYQKALIYGVINEDLEKLTSLESLIRKYPDSEYRDNAMFEIGESLLSLEKNNEAFKVYQAVVKEFGEESEYAPLSYLRKGLISYNQGDINSALKFYKKGLKLSEDPELQRQALFAIEEIYLNDMSDPEGYFDFVDSDVGFELETFKRDSISYQLGYRAYQESRFIQAIEAF